LRLCLPTTWQDGYLRSLSGIARPGASVHEVYGSLPRSATGSGRDAAIVPPVDPEAIRRHVELAHSLGFRFNYLMNGACMGGRELTAPGRAALAEQVRWISAIGADAVTVAIPYVAEVVRSTAPSLEIVVSTIAHVDSVPAARSWTALGARRINVSLMANRDLALLQALRDRGGCEIELLANEMCLYRCAARTWHYSLMAHASHEGATAGTIDYPQLLCSTARVEDPAELVKARFIRPEDVSTYEELGIDLVKLAGRGRDAAGLLGSAEAYASRRWDGDLLVLTDLGLFRPPGEERPRISIDNRALDGLLHTTAAVDCARKCGNGCGVCEDFARRAVRIAGGERYLEALARARTSLGAAPGGG
jgi:collagenase-like PrtC family protease